MLTARDIWRLALTTLRATWRQTVALAVVGLILPQVLVSLWFDARSASVVSGLRSLFTAGAPRTGSFMTLLAPGLAYAAPLVGGILLLFIVFLASYLALVHTAVDHWRGQAPAGAVKAWAAGLRTAVPGGLVLAAALFLLLMLGQILIAPALLIAVLGLVVPVALVVERRGAFQALWSAMTLRYAKRAQVSGWAVLFQLLTIAAVLYAALLAISVACENLLVLDERLGLVRTLWTMKVPGQDFGWVYATVSVVETILTMSCVTLLPALTAALYFSVATARTITEA